MDKKAQLNPELSFEASTHPLYPFITKEDVDVEVEEVVETFVLELVVVEIFVLELVVVGRVRVVDEVVLVV